MKKVRNPIFKTIVEATVKRKEDSAFRKAATTITSTNIKDSQSPYL